MIELSGYKKWLRSPRSERVVLFEFSDIKFSNKPLVKFIDGVPYSFASTMSNVFEYDSGLTGEISVGDVDLINNGRYDHLIGQYKGEVVTVKWGDPSWEYADFVTVAKLMIDDVSTINHYTIRLRFYSLSRVLDVPVSDVDSISNLPPISAAERLVDGLGMVVSTPFGDSGPQFSLMLSDVIEEGDTINDVLSRLLEPVGIYHRINFQGELELLTINHDQHTDAVFNINASDIERGSIRQIETVHPASSIKLLWVDPDPIGGGDIEISADTGLDLANYDPEEYETLINNAADAGIELQRRVAQRSIRRTLWGLSVFASAIDVKEGDRVAIHHPRFGFSGGVKGTVMRCVMGLGSRNRLELEILV